MIDEKEVNERELWESARKIRECCKSHLFDDANGYGCLRCPFYLQVHGYDGCAFDVYHKAVAPAHSWLV